jgi:poly-gamma-glutamate synthesis protein (capsule biosynthesis protein)
MCTLWLCGDVMTGRGIDQILPHPSSPELYEPMVASALEYVALARDANGAIPRTVDFAYVWGAALEELRRHRPAVRLVNLETSVTTSARAAPKGINYRMHPGNVGVLSVAGIDCVSLANNHVLDWGTSGLIETVDTLRDAGIRVAGAGRTLAEAARPATVHLRGGGRVLVFALGSFDSGVPPAWAAARESPGVRWIGDYGADTIGCVRELIAGERRDGDIVVVSIHWGANWGHGIPDEHRRFAHALIDEASVHVVHGHSSHHAKAIEVHHGCLILYGCGDFLNDYEGIAGHEEFRADLTLMYFPTLDPRTGALTELALVPLAIRNFRLQRPTDADRRWLRETLDADCRSVGTTIVGLDAEMRLEWR